MNTEQETTIRICLSKGNQLRVECQKIALPDMIQLCFAAIEATSQHVIDAAVDPKLKKSVKEDIYEMINLGASSLLNKMFPEIEARPDLTVDAMLEAENKLLEKDGKKYVEAYKESAQADKDVYESNMNKAKLAAIAANTPYPNRAVRRHNAKNKS